MIYFHLLKYPHQHCPKTFEVPILVYHRMNYPTLKHLLRLVGQEVEGVLHIVYRFRVFHISTAPLGEQLFAEYIDEIREVRGRRQLTVLEGIVNAHLEPVRYWPQ